MQLPALALSLFGLAAVANAGDYKDMCGPCQMCNGHTEDPNGHLLSCFCFNHHADWYNVHLNEHLGVDNEGRFVWTGKGGHRDVCSDYRLYHGRYFEATCRKADPAAPPHRGYIDLSKYVSYDMELGLTLDEPLS